MLLNLSIQYILQKKFRNFLASFAITIGTASLLLFLSLSNGIKNATFTELEKSSPLTQITVHPNMSKTGIVSFLTRSEKDKLSPQLIDTISKIDGVKNIYQEIQYNNFASLEASVLGFQFVTDAMLFGVPEGFVKAYVPNNQTINWQSAKEPYPAIIPKKLLDIYNFAIASPQGLPLLSEESLLGKKIMLYPNYSTYFPSLSKKSAEIELEVVGFSDNVNLIGATLPIDFVENLNKEYTSEPESKILELFVETLDASATPQVAAEIEKLGYTTVYYQKNLKEVEAKLVYLSIAIGIISAIILLSSAIAIITTFLAIAEERKKEIGLLRALGASKWHIKKIILFEATVLGIFGSVLGIIIGYIASLGLDKISLKELAKTSFQPETLFLITPNLILFTIVFGTLLSIFSALLPAQKAANTNPIEALK